MEIPDFKIKSVSELDELSHKVRWQYFERLVAFIFEQNDFKVKQGAIVKFESTKRQFDVLAERFGETWAVECKKQQRLNVSGAVAKHMERCALLAESSGKDVRPLIVTLSDEAADAEIPVVPLLKLNAFINDS